MFDFRWTSLLILNRVFVTFFMQIVCCLIIHHGHTLDKLYILDPLYLFLVLLNNCNVRHIENSVENLFIC
jgi:hypothetical protein